MNSPVPASRLRRKLWIAGIVLVVFTIVGFFVLPPIIKTQLEKRASAALGRTVTVGKVRVNPYALSLTLENFDIRSADGQSSFLGWQRLYVNFDALSSLTGDWVLSDIELEGFHAAVGIKPDGSFTFADILAKVSALAPPAATAVPAKPGRPLRIVSLKVAGAQVEFTDQSRTKPFATVVGPLTFNLTEFRTAGDRGAPYHFEASTESGEKLVWSGTLNADPVGSVGELQLENISLPKYSPYYADRVLADLVEGKLSVHGHYELSLAEGAHVLKLKDGSLQLRGLKVVERASQEAAVELPALDITGVNADALALKGTVASVSLAGGHLHVRREKDGSINLLTMFLPPAEAAAVAPVVTIPASAPATAPVAVAPAKFPDVTVVDVAVKDLQVDLTDLAAPRPAQLGLGKIQASVKNVTLADGAVIPVQLALEWAPKGTVRVEGTVSIKPDLKADLKTDIAALEILPLSPYLEEFINARITQGAVTTAGAVQVSMAGGQPAITFAGGVTVDKFGLVDGVHNEELAGFESLTLNGLKAATAPELTVSLTEIKVTAPYAHVIVNADKSLNVASVAKAGAPVVARAPDLTKAVGADLPKVDVGQIVISEGVYSLTDRSVEPHVQTAVNHFGGTITGVSTDNLTKADVDLKATVDGSGPIAITGKIDLLGGKRFADLKLNFRSVDLLPFSPYTGKYAGYELARGQLALDIKVQLDGTQIDMATLITMNQFTFGAPVKSPDATGLPVRLGVALLKDNDGQIVIDVPVSGDLADPSFKVGKVVIRVIINLLTKVATSPFSLLGAMFGGGGPELAFQEFTPGASELQPAEQPKLATIIKALTNRPGLSLALEGNYDGPADTYALKHLKLTAQVRNKIWEERHATDPNIPPPDKLEITPEAEAAMVKKMFDEKFPPGTQFGQPLGKAPVAAAAPPAPPKGFFSRMVDVVTFKKMRSGEGKPAAVVKPAAAAAGVAVAGPALDEMTGRLAETVEVTDEDLRALATARAQRVRDYLLNEGKISAERLFLTQASEAAKTNKGPRTFLNLQ